MSHPRTGRRLLVLDDDQGVVDFLCESLGEHGYDTAGMTSPLEALERIRREHFDLVISDIEMPELRGLELLQAILEDRPSQLVLLITAFGTIEVAVAAVKAGACDFVAKPFKIEALVLAIERAFTDRQLRREIVRLRATRPANAFDDLIADSVPMRRVLDVARRAARSPSPILLAGEPGTGKSLLARFIHRAGGEASRPYVEVDCTGTAAEVERRIFGAPGAGDAVEPETGAFATVGDGTLVLDEIGALPLQLQPRLLEVLEARTMVPPVKARIVCTTSRALEESLREGRVRPDLYSRLNVVRIDVPPLRERREDIVPLVDRFLGRTADSAGDRGAALVGVSAAAMRRLVLHEWPGNVRELAHVVERAVALAEHDTIVPQDIELEPMPHGIPGLGSGPKGIVPLDEVERLYVRYVLRATGGNKAAAARALRINRRTLYRMLEE